MPTDFDGPLDFTEDPGPLPGFDPLRFDLISLSPVPGYVVVADANGNPIWAHPSSVATIGATGATGPSGPPGSDGPPGEPGDRGFPGLQGSAGAAGANGAVGERGPPGMDGPPGAEGPQGPVGITGAAGATGATGATGFSGITGYSPILAPASPSAYDDEFDDLSLNVLWTTTATGVGASGTVDETLREGYVNIPCTDGGAGSTRGIWKAYTPGAALLTVVARLFYDVNKAGSNQQSLFIQDGAGATLYGVGIVNGSAAIYYDASFGTVTITYITGNAGEIYLMVQRDATTNYQSFVSGDGFTWHRLSGASRAGTIGRIQLTASSFSSTKSDGWWDFVRTFASNTFDIGGTP